MPPLYFRENLSFQYKTDNRKVACSIRNSEINPAASTEFFNLSTDQKETPSGKECFYTLEYKIKVVEELYARH